MVTPIVPNSEKLNNGLTYDVSLILSTGASRKTMKWKAEEYSWSKLLQRIQKVYRTPESYEEYLSLSKDAQGDIKDVGGYVCGELRDGKRKNGHVISRQVVTLDADHIKGDFWEGVTLFFDHAAAIYSTHKHSSKSPRYRLLIPLDRAVGPEEYEAIARKIAEDLGMSMFDSTTFQSHRLMYWPSAAKDGEFDYQYQDAPILSADSVLAQYSDWRKASEWPKHPSQMQEINRKREKAGDPLEKPGFIGAFCRTYNIHEAIEKFLSHVYEPSGDGRYTFVGGSTTGGLVIYDDLYAYSHHSTDPCSEQLVNAFDLVRLHLFGEKDDNAKASTPVNRLPSFKAMNEFAKKDEKVEVLAIEEALGGALDDFDEIEEGEESSSNNNRRGVSADLFFDPLNGFDVMRLCDVILERVPVICVNNRLFVYKKGVYVSNDEAKTIDRLVNKLLGSRTRIGYRREVMEYLKTECIVSDGDLLPNTDIINLKNGLLEWRTGELKPHESDFISFTQLPVKFEPQATCEVIEKFIKEVVPADTVDLVFEVFGLNMIPEPKYTKAVFLTGSGANGKSKFMELFQAFIGIKNISNVSLQDLERNRFKLAHLEGKLANVYPDLASTSLEKTDVFKTVVAGDRVNAERKGQDSFDFKPYARLLFSMNEIPRTLDTSDGFLRRMLIIHFPNKFGPGGKEADVDILKKLTTDTQLSGLLNKAVAGLRNLENRGKFIENDSTATALNEYKLFNDPVEAFLNECCVIGEDKTVDTKELYGAYTTYLYESGFRSVKEDGRNYFYKKIEGKGYLRKRLSASSPTVFVGLDLAEEMKMS